MVAVPHADNTVIAGRAEMTFLFAVAALVANVELLPGAIRRCVTLGAAHHPAAWTVLLEMAGLEAVLAVFG